MARARKREAKRMATIDIQRNHHVGKEKAREVAQLVADRLKEKAGINCKWNGDTLEFERTGAKGTLKVSETQVTLAIDLGMLLRPMKGTIEAKITEYFDRYLKT